VSKKTFFFFIIFIFTYSFVFSQEDDGYILEPEFNSEYKNETEEYSESDIYDIIEPQPDSIFIINSFIFNIKGFTRPYALINKGELKIDEELNGIIELEKYIQEKTQKLYNERVLDSVNIFYTIGQLREDGKYPVDLTVITTDTWNIIALPRPKFSSSTGYDITLKARDYNFLGTMSPLRLDIGYVYDTKQERHKFLLALDSNINFFAFNHNWYILFAHKYNYRPDTELPNFYSNTIGLSVEQPVKSTTITLGFNESFFLNEENPDFYKSLYGTFEEGYYMTSSPYVSWKIPTGLEVGAWDELVYTPGISATFYHEFDKWPLDEIRKGPVLTFKHYLGFSRIDWVDNFRKGMDVSVNNSYDYSFYKLNHIYELSSLNNDKNPWVNKIDFTGVGHFKLNKYFGISTKLKYSHWFFSDYGREEAGDVLRGIIDKNIYADHMLSLNLDFPIKVLRFTPSKWLNKQSFRVFNFDLHVSPIIDMALFHDPVNDIDFNFKNIIVTGGVEVIVFPEFFRSLYLRVSYGRSLSTFNNKTSSEIYIGTDFHY